MPENKVPGDGTPATANGPWTSMAGRAIRQAVSMINSERPSLDGIVRIFADLPGAAKIIDERPQVVVIVFEDGSGVGVNSRGIDLLEPSPLDH